MPLPAQPDAEDIRLTHTQGFFLFKTDIVYAVCIMSKYIIKL